MVCTCTKIQNIRISIGNRSHLLYHNQGHIVSAIFDVLAISNQYCTVYPTSGTSKIQCYVIYTYINRYLKPWVAKFKFRWKKCDAIYLLKGHTLKNEKNIQKKIKKKKQAITSSL